MTTASDIIDSALRNINMPVDLARNDQEMLRMLNQALAERDSRAIGGVVTPESQALRESIRQGLIGAHVNRPEFDHAVARVYELERPQEAIPMLISFVINPKAT
jgi:hypothetical protein